MAAIKIKMDFSNTLFPALFFLFPAAVSAERSDPPFLLFLPLLLLRHLFFRFILGRLKSRNKRIMAQNKRRPNIFLPKDNRRRNKKMGKNINSRHNYYLLLASAVEKSKMNGGEKFIRQNRQKYFFLFRCRFLAGWSLRSQVASL